MLGGYGAGRSVEYLAPQVTCRLPDLSRDMYSPSVNFVQDTIVACYKDSCDKLQQGAWVKMADTRQNRSDHTSEVIGDSILLIGGTDSPTTTELVRVSGESVEGFSLGTAGRREHCSVKISDGTVVTIGGFGSWSQVTEYMGIGGEVTTRELPELLTGREQHVCGQYTAGETRVMAALVSHWTLTGPTLDPHWTLTGPSLDSHWTLIGPSLDPHLTLIGLSLVPHWTLAGPSLDPRWSLTGRA